MNRSLLFIIFLALILRIPGLGDSFWLDEAAQALESVRPLSEQLSIVVDFQPPLIHLIVHFSHYFSRGEVWLRTWAALIPGLLAIIFTYLIGKKLFSERVGIVAALFLATSSFHVFYSQELRPYALPAVFAIMTWYWLITQKHLDNQYKLLYIFSTIAGLYSSYLYPFVVMAQVIYLLFLPSEIRKHFFNLLLVSATAFLPWLPMFFAQLDAGQKLRIELPGWESVVSTPQLKSLPLVFGKFFYGIIDIDLSILFLIPILIITSVVFFSIIKNKYKLDKVKKNSLIALTLWAFAGIFIAWVVSFFVPVLQPKRVLFALPAIYLLISYFLVAPLGNRSDHTINIGKRQVLNLFAIFLMFAINLFGLYQYYFDGGLRRENWRDLVAEIQQKYPENSSIIIVSFPEAFAPLRWYPSNYRMISTGELTTSKVPDLADLIKPIVEYEYVLTFDYLTDLTDSQKLIPKTIEAFGYKQVDYSDNPGIGFVRIYSKTKSVTANARWN